MIALAIISSWWFLQTQQTVPCWERPVANDRTYMTMNAAPASLAQIPIAVKLTNKQAKLFWSKVDKTDACWLWNGPLGKGGYGLINIVVGGGVRKTFRVHRVAYCLANGLDMVPKSVLHKCDVPRCVNPDHLFAGTHEDNMVDKMAKGRQAKGEGIGNSILKESEIRVIHELWMDGATQTGIAKRFGVSQATVWQVLRGQTWKHVV